MIKARVGRLEKAFGGVEEPWKGTIRLAPFFDDEPIPIANPGEDLILLHVIRTPRPPAIVPTNGGAPTDADLQAEIARLEEERDTLKQKKTIGLPRRKRRGVGIRVGLEGGER